jgi:serine protease Do
MKTKSNSFLNSSLALLFTLPAFALEAPEDNAPPPVAARQQINLPEIKLPPAASKMAPAAQAPTAFLGIVSGNLPAVLSEHLALKPGEGVLIHSLVPGGPAAQAGLAVNDVITKIAGKPVGSPSEVSQQIASRRPGDKVPVELIHKGRSTQLDVVLAERPANLAEANEPRVIDPQMLHGLPDELAERIRNAVAGNLGGLDFQLGKIKEADVDQLRDAVKDLFNRQSNDSDPGNFPRSGEDESGKIQLQSGATVKMQDAQGSVEVHAKDGDKQVTMRDSQNQVTWSGPWNSEKDKAAAPESVRARMDSLKLDTEFQGSGLRFQVPPQGN